MITQEQARGDSIGLTRGEYEKHVAAGKAALKSYLFPVSEFMRDGAWQSVQSEWGGVTIDTRSQWPIEPEFGYALRACGSPFDWTTLSIPLDALNRETFNDTYALAMRRFAGAPYIGIFRDDDTGLVEFDAVVIVATEQEARDIGTLCEGIGGAYSFETGNGVFPYHVLSTSNWRDDHPHEHTDGYPEHGHTANWNPAAHPEHKRDSNSIPSDADWFISPEFS